MKSGHTIEEGSHLFPRLYIITFYRHCYGLHSPNPLSSNPSLRLWKLLLLDIRPRSQFDSGRLPPAVSLDMSSPDWRDRIIDLTASACSVPLGASPQAIAARARRPSDPGATKISGQGFEDMGDGEVKVGVKRGIEKVQLPSLNYHICVMAGDDSEAESRLADHLCYILTRELFLKSVISMMNFCFSFFGSSCFGHYVLLVIFPPSREIFLVIDSIQVGVDQSWRLQRSSPSGSSI